MVAFSGSPEKNSQVTSAVASSIWDLYEKSGKGVLPGESLDLLILNCEVMVDLHQHVIMIIVY